jgi:hypothetical protein
MAVSLLMTWLVAVEMAVQQLGPEGNQMPVYLGTEGVPQGREGTGMHDDCPPVAGDGQEKPLL